jgi:hypothetical protein
MSETYSSTLATLANLMGDPLLVSDANFLQIMPSTIDDAEQRICREVDFLGAVVTTTGVVTTANLRLINWSNSFFVVESVNAISPAGTTNPDLGTRNPLLPATKEMLDYLYPSITGAGIPKYLGRVTQDSAVLGPWPDAAYTLEITGTQRPATLSVSNNTTFISTYLPDLFISACMIYLSAYAQNFSAMGDNPAQAVNWDSHYKEELKSAVVEEARKRFTSEGWSPAQPTQGLATPART